METLFIGKNTIFLPQINSTNSYAIDLLKNVNPVEGTVVYTADQTAGKGQRGNLWESEPLSNLNASIILKPSVLDIKKSFYLYQIAALACYDCLAELLDSSQIDIKIKWPNDILVNGKKIAGILIENSVQSDAINWSVIGIGINVNQEKFISHTKATSLKHFLGNDFPVQELVKILCRKIEKYYLWLKSEKFSLISQEYLSRLYGLNARLNFEYGNRVLTLMVTGISDAGLLMLEDEKSNVIQADVKEIKWRY
jgi:BirA family transcriptional regulator, biotin operon repressor / biotin---[acetyl-CoA-carboxylase] ligase